MTDRINGLTVFLKNPLREDDVQALVVAIELFSGVMNVQKHIYDTDCILSEHRGYMKYHNELLAFMGSDRNEPDS